VIDDKLVRSLQILAIKAAEDPDAEDYYERICRWYSREFSTKLTEVREADPAHVMKVFYDDHFLSLKTGDEHAEREYEKQKLMIIFPEEYKDSLKTDDDWVKKLEEEMTKEEGKMKKKTSKIIGKAYSKASKATKKVVESIASSDTKGEKELNLSDEFKIPDSGSFGE